ncbi:DEKNAAC105230 [Brettanomyces naardenensis]|uniref:DEKNAAC105230 n=1 Tax=Brettanomyces naardenensis TaxID=13370 RepID=A0A448YT22_BRENA|nr:DEKNAAC105230 [Brettanomyces naardenensis]
MVKGGKSGNRTHSRNRETASRNHRQSRHQEPELEDVGMDEVDEFEQEKEKILLKEAGWNSKEVEEEDEEEQEEAVLGIEGEEGDEDEDDQGDDEDQADIEQYRRKLQGPVDEDEEEYFIDNEDKEGEEEADSDDAAWGNDKGDYYGAEDLEEEEEEDAKEMEKEAIRIQKKHLEELNMDDYMLDETIDEWKTEDNEEKKESKEKENVDVSKLDKSAQRELLNRRYPEFIPLTKEYESLKGVLEELKKKRNEENSDNEVVNMKFSTLSSYLGTVATYFAIFLSKLREGEQFSMKDESIMESILNSREIWYEARGIGEEVEEIDDGEDLEGEDLEGEDLEAQEVEEVEEVEGVEESEEPEDTTDEPVVHTIKHLKRKGIEDIDEVDAEEKRGHRKTLGFYTSKIDQKEKKKMNRFQGDEDIPYKERLFERQQRLIEEARKRGDRSNRNAPGVDLDGDDDGNDDEVVGTGEDYYEKIKMKKEGKKVARRQAHELVVKAAREGKLAEIEENVGEDGKRAINYQILKNRGLTKKRKKEDRNARVKKRKRYSEAKKKLKSVRSVYKTPEGPYQGETTGIKKNISRSVKLN